MAPTKVAGEGKKRAFVGRLGQEWAAEGEAAAAAALRAEQDGRFVELEGKHNTQVGHNDAQAWDKGRDEQGQKGAGCAVQDMEGE